VDGLLERAINLNFVALGKEKYAHVFRDPMAPLSSFSAKILIAYALGIIDNEYKSQLDRFRSIRNVFAHAVKPVDFETDIIAAECNKLDPQRLMKAKYEPETDSPRERFTTVGTFIGLHLTEYCKLRIDQIGDGTRPLPSPFRGKFG
jgi:hypothetical protein